MKKAYSTNKDNYITFMFVSGPDEEIKKIRIKKNILKSTAVLTALILTYSATTLTGFLDLCNNYSTALNRIEYLEKDISRQEKEIAGIYNYSDQVRNKMENLIKFDGEVRNMVGLKDQSDKRLEEFEEEFEEVIVASSRGEVDREDSEDSEGRTTGIIAAEMVFEEDNSIPVMLSSVNQLNDSIQILSSQMDVQKSELDKLLNDVDARLAYLEARPSFLPIYGRITSRFGGRKHPFTKGYQFHRGVDIATSRGTSIKATGKGVVTFSGWNGGYGKVVIINHGYGIKTVYAHNSTNLVKTGDRVEKGQIIAKVGTTGMSTGPHVHFEVQVKGKVVDPLKFIKGN